MWNLVYFSFKSYRLCVGIVLNGFSRGSHHHIHIMNVYTPYNNHKAFQDKVDASGIMDIHSLIIVGGLNLNLEAKECWDQNPRRDPLVGFFKHTFNRNFLRDVAPSLVCLTQRNRWIGVDGITKWIYRFLVHLHLCHRMQNVQSTTFFLDVSNHYPILLEWGDEKNMNLVPFKFNHMWLNEPEFNDLVRNYWNGPFAMNIFR